MVDAEVEDKDPIGAADAEVDAVAAGTVDEPTG